MTEAYIERDRGILTESDRRYIKNPGEFSRQAAHQRQEAIRDRLREAVRDFQLLADDVDQQVYDELFGPERTVFEEDESGDRVGGTEIPPERFSLPFGVEFLIRLSLADETDVRPGFHEMLGVENPLRPFLRNVERGIQMYLNNHEGLSAEIDVSIDTTEIKKIDRVVDQLSERNEPLTGRERIEMVARLSRAGYSTGEITELVGEDPGSNDSTGG